LHGIIHGVMRYEKNKNMTQEFNLDLRVVIKGNNADEVTEEDLKKFLFFELVGGSIGNDNPLAHYDGDDCEIDWIDVD